MESLNSPSFLIDVFVPSKLYDYDRIEKVLSRKLKVPVACWESMTDDLVIVSTPGRGIIPAVYRWMTKILLNQCLLSDKYLLAKDELS